MYNLGKDTDCQSQKSVLGICYEYPGTAMQFFVLQKLNERKKSRISSNEHNYLAGSDPG